MQDADRDNVIKVAVWLLKEFRCDSTWFAAAWADIYREMRRIEAETREGTGS